MKLPRRAFLHLAAGATTLPGPLAGALPQSSPTGKPSEPSVRPLAERLAAYAYGLRYEDLDDATIERVKTHVIDTIGCGMGAWDEEAGRDLPRSRAFCHRPCDHHWHRSANDS